MTPEPNILPSLFNRIEYRGTLVSAATSTRPSSAASSGISPGSTARMRASAGNVNESTRMATQASNTLRMQ